MKFMMCLSASIAYVRAVMIAEVLAETERGYMLPTMFDFIGNIYLEKTFHLDSSTT
jgi:hypothetical protein